MGREVYIVGAARTAIGSFQGALAAVSAPKLGATAAKAAIERAGVPVDAIDEAYFGNVLTTAVGQAPARQAARFAGVPDKVPAVTVGKVCGSGLMSVIMGAKSILLEDAEVVLAGGMESMSQAPYAMPGARDGYRMGNKEVIDTMVHDGLWDPYDQIHMGLAAELGVEELGLTREAQDEYALESYRRAQAAQADGTFAREIVPVEIVGRKGTVTVDQDEEPGRARPDKVPTLRPAFKKDGTITAANASKINDGAAAVMLASKEAVEKYGLKPLAKIVGYGGHAMEPKMFTMAPIGAIETTLKKVGMQASDIDLWEVNEAFAVVAMGPTLRNGVSHENMNVFGGAVSMGHPIGASGTRILVTLLNALESKDKQRGLATLCIGGGEALAMVVERV